jgi:ankyrin repeat protein
MGSLSLIQILIDRGASVTEKIYPEDLTPSELAEREGQHRAYQLLVSRGAPPVDAASSAQFSLISSAERADLNGMEAAVKNGAKINNPINNQTALNVALGGYIYNQPRVSAVIWLLDHGADPNVGNGIYFPLDDFVLSSSFTLRELNKMTEDDLKAIKQSTGKEFNVEQARAFNEEILLRLLKAGAKVSSRNKFGWTPLHVAAANDNVMAAKILIKEGAKIMQRTNDGKTPLDLAESAAMIKLLKDNGAVEQ